MATIKKAYKEIVSLLEANRDQQVSDVIDSVIELASAKTGGGGGKASAFHRAEDGTVLAVRDFYFKRWVSPLVMEFGEKKSSPSGLNSMSKEGVSKWTKQQREYKKASEDLLQQMLTGELTQDELPAHMEEIEQAREEIQPIESVEGYEGFDNLDACLADLSERGLI